MHAKPLIAYAKFVAQLFIFSLKFGENMIYCLKQLVVRGTNAGLTVSPLSWSRGRSSRVRRFSAWYTVDRDCCGLGSLPRLFIYGPAFSDGGKHNFESRSRSLPLIDLLSLDSTFSLFRPKKRKEKVLTCLAARLTWYLPDVLTSFLKFGRRKKSSGGGRKKSKKGDI